jgi:hypothetical protein
MYESGELAELFGVDQPDDEEERLEDVTTGPPAHQAGIGLENHLS